MKLLLVVSAVVSSDVVEFGKPEDDDVLKTGNGVMELNVVDVGVPVMLVDAVPSKVNPGPGSGVVASCP
jgi:hypothetical protein